jgi:chromosome segregation ATPase
MIGNNMDKETIQALAELGVAALALVAVVIIAYIILNRAKSDTSTIKVFADLLTTSYKKISDDVEIHGNQSTTRHGEMVLALQNVTVALTKIINSDADILKEVQEVKKTGGDIMATVTPIDQILQEIRNELQQLRQSVDNHLDESTKFRDNVTAKTTEIESRLLQVETRVTEESVKIDPQTKPTKEKKDDGNTIGHSRRLDNPTGTDSDTGSSPGGDDSKTLSA